MMKKLLFFILISFFLCSCGNSDQTLTKTLVSPLNLYNSDYCIELNDHVLDLTSPVPFIINNEDKKATRFIRDPFIESEKSKTIAACYYDNNIYYCQRDNYNYYIKKIQLSNYEEKIIYVEENYRPKKQLFLGLIQQDSQITYKSENRIIGLIADAGNLFIIKNNKIDRLNLKNNSFKTIVEDNFSIPNISYYNNIFYYIDEYHDLYSFDCSTLVKKKIINNKCSRLFVSSNYILYNNLSDYGNLYRMDLNGQNNKLILSEEVMCFGQYGNNIFYTLKKNNHLYLSDINGKHVKLLSNNQIYAFLIMEDNIYIVSDAIMKTEYTEVELFTLEPQSGNLVPINKF